MILPSFPEYTNEHTKYGPEQVKLRSLDLKTLGMVWVEPNHKESIFNKSSSGIWVQNRGLASKSPLSQTGTGN